MRLRRVVTITVGGLALCFAAAAMLDRWSFERAKSKYPLGIKIEEAVAKMDRAYPIQTAEPVYLPGHPTDEEKSQIVVYTIIVERDGVILEFNVHRRLIRLWKMRDPVTRWWIGRHLDRQK